VLWYAAIGNLYKQLLIATITSGGMRISPSYMKFEYPFFSNPPPPHLKKMKDMKEAIAINIST